jgi:hypothetical protein
MEDASGIDLDWFWRGWFYSTDHVDLAISDVKLYQIDAGDPDQAAERKRKQREEKEPTLSQQRNKDLRKRIDWQPGLKDFYNSAEYDELAVEDSARKSFQKMLDDLDPKDRAMLRRTTNFYVIEFENVGGLVMPVIMRIYYTDNTNELVTYPPQIWRQNSKSVKKLWVTEKEIARIVLDPRREIADTEESNNHWPERFIPSRFQLYKSNRSSRNPMQKDRAKKKAEQKPEEKKD